MNELHKTFDRGWLVAVRRPGRTEGFLRIITFLLVDQAFFFENVPGLL
jgi:hypothetical protein